MVVVVLRIIGFALTPELDDGVPYLEFFAYHAVDFLGEFRGFTDKHVLRIDMGAHGVHTRGYCPYVDIVRVINAGNLFEAFDKFVNINLLGSGLQQDVNRFHNQFVRPKEDQHADYDANDGVDDKPFGKVNNNRTENNPDRGHGVSHHVNKRRLQV